MRPSVALDPEQIGRYARVCGFIPEQGVPVTFPHVMAFPLHLMLLTDPAFPWPAIGLVHVSNSVRLRRTLHPGQALRIEVESGALVPHRQRPGIHAAYENLSWRRGGLGCGQRVSEARCRESRGASAVVENSVADLADTPPAALLREARWQLPAQLGRDYAKASGDFNPIHLHALSAKAFGFPRAIAHGMWTLGRTLAALQPSKQLGAANVQGDFKSPIFLPAETTLWTAALSTTARDFEVRDLAGERLHLRGRFEWELP